MDKVVKWNKIDKRFKVCIRHKNAGRIGHATSFEDGATYRYDGNKRDVGKVLVKNDFEWVSDRPEPFAKAIPVAEPVPCAPAMPKAERMEYPVTLIGGQLVDAGYWMNNGNRDKLVDIIKALLVQPELTKKELPLKNKYDRVVVGKYGTGSCVIDVYRVLDAFPGTAAVEHANKKSLAPGSRGAKGYKQDIQEAIQSLQAELDLINDREV